MRVVGWSITLALALAGWFELAALVAGYALAILLAATDYARVREAPPEMLGGGGRLAHRGATGALVAFSVAGLVGSVTGVTGASLSRHVLDAPLALFFVTVAILGWRALTVQSPRRAVLATIVALLAYLPLGAAAAVSHSVVQASWYRDVIHVATAGTLLSAGVLALVTALAFRARAVVPAARQL